MKALQHLLALGCAACLVVAGGAHAQASGSGMEAASTTNGASAKAVKKADRQLAGRVRAALAKAPGLNVSGIAVKAKNGAVWLTGEVDDQSQIDTAGNAAKAVSGVTSVTNKLGVKLK